MSFKFIYAPYDITIRNPDFGDIRRVQANDIRRRTANGDLKVYAWSEWASLRIHSYNFSIIKSTDITALMGFFTESAGIPVVIVNQGSSYNGVIWTPVEEIIRTRPNCSNSLAFEFLELGL